MRNTPGRRMLDCREAAHPVTPEILKMSSRTIVRLVVGVLLTVTLSGCAGRKAPFTIGVNGWPPCEIWYVAEKQGYFGKTPVKIVGMLHCCPVEQAHLAHK
jgi:ABC-type nitrate/sulfonate/bicarbonate transport system substrate-binding protein